MEEVKVEQILAEKQRIEDFIDKGLVYECSGAVTHAPVCNGDCEIQELDPLDREIGHEYRKWREIGMIPEGVPNSLTGRVPGIPVDLIKESMRMSALLEYLIEDGADEAKLNQKFREKLLAFLREIREANQESIIAEQTASRIVPAGIQKAPEVFVPNYMKDRLH